MNLLKIVFTFELRMLRRQRLVLCLIAFFFLTGLYSIYDGYHLTKKQLTAIDSLERNYDQKFNELAKNFTADTTTSAGKTSYAQAGIPSVIEYRNPLNAIHKPATLSSLSVGQRDILPYYEVITRKRNAVNAPNAEITNPEMLAAGNFDLAYVIIYLFPLLAIALSYNTWSKEKEQQTDRLLAVQGKHLERIIVYKLGFRFTVVALLAWLLSAIGIISDSQLSSFNLTTSLLWFFAVTVYLAFWFSTCLLLIKLGKSSAVNALYLLAAWCFFLLVLPAITNAFIRQIYPIPLKMDEAVALRENSEAIWAMPKQALIDTFYANHPNYNSLKSATDTSDNSTVRFSAYYDLLGRKMTSVIARYNQYPRKQNLISAKLSWINPATKTQYLLNSITESGLTDYLSYQNQVNHFQKTWVDFMTDYIIHNRTLSLADLHHLPEFKMQPAPGKNTNILTDIFGLLIISLSILFLSTKIKLPL
ncbi:ABC-2 type transport system permease protein [Pedobacter terrae]|uniref:ABC-2 type transport system permease protein n=1 Tax=Pedobacter terrae TaxID=405671 RepID=A0A1G7NI60_9SPHI|nr:ABC transporter permease [Pedobacter terrae]SDF73607.1 ABC-2 type transport system permease protein [Pedobacter terrae]